MTTSALVLAMTVGAAALALWTYVRSEAHAPGRARVQALNLGVALAAVYLVVPAVMKPMIGDGESIGRTLAGLFGVFLPALVYAFLSGLWVFAGFARALHTR